MAHVVLVATASDELIRQVTIESPERGLLLLRVRDEIRMTLDAYKTLYDSRYTGRSGDVVYVAHGGAFPVDVLLSIVAVFLAHSV